MEAVFLKLLNMSISAGWLILAVLFLRIILKKAPKWIHCILWALVGIRLICPISVESVFSLIPSAETVPQEILYTKEPAIHSGILILNSVVNPVISESLAPTVEDSVNPMQVITFLASYIWLAGLVVMMIYAVVSYFRIHRKVAVSVSLRDNIYLCDYIETPFILGILKPHIFLPSTLEGVQADHVIAHEKAHLQRRDHWWKPLGFVLLAIYWFNPLIWLAYVLLCKDIELACDESVIRKLGESGKKAYSDTLLFCSVPRKMIMACPLAFGEVSVKERVSSVLSYKKPTFWILAAALTACIIAAICFLTNPKENLLYAPEPIGHSYTVEEVVYDDIRYSSVYPMDRTSQYSFTADYCMMVKGYTDVAEKYEEWTSLGSLQEVELTKDNFDKYFLNAEGTGWVSNLSAGKLRRNNKTAWQMMQEAGDEGKLSYYLLQQKSGEVYLICWYHNAETATETEDSNVRWVLKLMQTDYITCNVDADQKSTYVEMAWYPDGQFDFNYEELPVAVVDIRATLVFTVEDDIPTLTVGEDFYTYPEEGIGTVISETYTLKKNTKGTYKLAIERKSSLGEEQVIYYIPYGEGKYVFKVVFPGEENFELVGNTYAATECLYMTPFSSSFPPNDAGRIYEVTEDAVIVRRKVIDYEEEDSFSVDKWQWQEFPYTDEEWAAMFPGGDIFGCIGGSEIHSQYQEMLYQPLDNHTFLLKMDGELWIVKLHNGGKAGDLIWSIFVLEQIEAWWLE